MATLEERHALAEKRVGRLMARLDRLDFLVERATSLKLRHLDDHVSEVDFRKAELTIAQRTLASLEQQVADQA